jgi:hypothetical protein
VASFNTDKTPSRRTRQIPPVTSLPALCTRPSTGTPAGTKSSGGDDTRPRLKHSGTIGGQRRT